MPAPATTYAEFARRSNSTKRYLILLTALNRTTLVTKLFYLSNIGGEDIVGYPVMWHGKVKAIPALTYNTGDFDGSEIPSWSDMVLLREDGYDISFDRSGITMDQLGNEWIVRDQVLYVFYGGDNLPWSEYKTVAYGYMAGIKRTDTAIVIEFEGAASKANRATLATLKVDSVTYPNAGVNTDKTIPLIIGYVFNMRPFIVDFTTDTYIFHDNTIPYASLSVYQDGATLTPGTQYTDNANGTFTLVAPATGQITCFALTYGFSPWATIITNVLQTYAGIPIGQIDSAAVTQANIDLSYSVGHVFMEETPVLEAIDTLSMGIPAHRGFTRSGIYTMKEWKDPSAATPDWVINSLRSNTSPVPFIDGSCSERTYGIPVQTCNLQYYPNYYPMGDDRLSGVLTPLQKSIFSTPWRSAIFNDPTVVTRYPQATTLKKAIRSPGVAGLAAKWVGLSDTERKEVVLSVKTQILTYEIGDVVEVTYETFLRDGSSYFRHGYNTTNMLIKGIHENYTTKTTTLTLWF